MIRKILVIRFSSLGDIILLTPLFREIKKCFPHALVDFLTSSEFEDICQNNPYLNNILVFNRREQESLKNLAATCRSREYDLILDAHYSLRSRHLLWLWFGISRWRNPKIVSIDKRSRKRNLLLWFGINLFPQVITQREAYCNLLAQWLPSSPDLTTELFPGENERTKAKQILKEHFFDSYPVIALGPGASHPGKCWPKHYYFSLIQKLEEKNYKIILLGGAQDSEPKWLEERCNRKNVVNLAGKLSYLETGAILQKCQTVVSNDSAIVHFAEAVGTPAISIFGPTVKEFGYAPYHERSQLVEVNLKCRPCSRNGKGRCWNPVQRECLTSISPDSLFLRVEKLLDQLPEGHSRESK